MIKIICLTRRKKILVFFSKLGNAITSSFKNLRSIFSAPFKTSRKENQQVADSITLKRLKNFFNNPKEFIKRELQRRSATKGLNNDTPEIIISEKYGTIATNDINAIENHLITKLKEPETKATSYENDISFESDTNHDIELAIDDHVKSIKNAAIIAGIENAKMRKALEETSKNSLQADLNARDTGVKNKQTVNTI